MSRTLTPLAVALVLCAAADAQPPVIRTGRDTVIQPQGVITAPSLPSPWNLNPTNGPRPLPRPFMVAAPYYGPYGYSPFWPVWYDTDPVPTVNSVVPVPVPVYTAPSQTTIVLPSQPEEIRARLALTVPMRSRVWMAGKEVDANSSPLVLESPALRDGQSYTFDVKVTWPVGERSEERTRRVTVAAGEQKSLTYQK
jgi:uncharacterized protein (TIGR03000 family)